MGRVSDSQAVGTFVLSGGGRIHADVPEKDSNHKSSIVRAIPSKCQLNLAKMQKKNLNKPCQLTVRRKSEATVEVYSHIHTSLGSYQGSTGSVPTYHITYRVFNAARAHSDILIDMSWDSVMTGTDTE